MALPRRSRLLFIALALICLPYMYYAYFADDSGSLTSSEVLHNLASLSDLDACLQLAAGPLVTVAASRPATRPPPMFYIGNGVLGTASALGHYSVQLLRDGVDAVAITVAPLPSSSDAYATGAHVSVTDPSRGIQLSYTRLLPTAADAVAPGHCLVLETARFAVDSTYAVRSTLRSFQQAPTSSPPVDLASTTIPVPTKSIPFEFRSLQQPPHWRQHLSMSACPTHTGTSIFNMAREDVHVYSSLVVPTMPTTTLHVEPDVPLWWLSTASPLARDCPDDSPKCCTHAAQYATLKGDALLNTRESTVRTRAALTSFNVSGHSLALTASPRSAYNHFASVALMHLLDDAPSLCGGHEHFPAPRAVLALSLLDASLAERAFAQWHTDDHVTADAHTLTECLHVAWLHVLLADRLAWFTHSAGHDIVDACATQLALHPSRAKHESVVAFATAANLYLRAGMAMPDKWASFALGSQHRYSYSPHTAFMGALSAPVTRILAAVQSGDASTAAHALTLIVHAQGLAEAANCEQTLDASADLTATLLYAHAGIRPVAPGVLALTPGGRNGVTSTHVKGLHSGSLVFSLSISPAGLTSIRCDSSTPCHVCTTSSDPTAATTCKELAQHAEYTTPHADTGLLLSANATFLSSVAPSSPFLPLPLFPTPADALPPPTPHPRHMSFFLLLVLILAVIAFHIFLGALLLRECKVV